MDKQSVLIIVVALTVLIWGGWQSYIHLSDITDSYLNYKQSFEQIGKVRTVIHLFVKIIPVMFFIGGLGLVMVVA